MNTHDDYYMNDVMESIIRNKQQNKMQDNLPEYFRSKQVALQDYYGIEKKSWPLTQTIHLRAACPELSGKRIR